MWDPLHLELLHSQIPEQQMDPCIANVHPNDTHTHYNPQEANEIKFTLPACINILHIASTRVKYRVR